MEISPTTDILIYLVCGYKTTGKDTLFKQLIKRSDIPFNWIVYVDPSKNTPKFNPNKLSHLERRALADELKKEIVEMLMKDHESKLYLFSITDYLLKTNSENKNITLTEISKDISKMADFISPLMTFKIPTIDDYIEILNKCKEIPLFDGKSFRDLCIEHAAFRRNQKQTYWSDLIFSNIKSSIMCTDWRNLDEEKVARSKSEVRTIRVYRSDVPVPPMDDKSEHSLDNITTDYFLVRSEEEFKKGCEIFPQYKSYAIEEP